MLRKIISVSAGLLVALLFIFLGERVSARLYPIPEGMDIADRAAMQAYIDSLPAAAFILILSGYFVASFFCGAVIRLISGSADNTPAFFAGIGLTTVGIVNFFSFEHPWWVIITGLLIFLPATLLGFTLIRKKG
ncbi:MAG TPA: hypothetical protein VL098_00180 [Flavipsychrobacter sp.]|nr:hypothetical protein [Flavipsychrobacter sp.]